MKYQYSIAPVAKGLFVSAYNLFRYRANRPSLFVRYITECQLDWGKTGDTHAAAILGGKANALTVVASSIGAALDICGVVGAVAWRVASTTSALARAKYDARRLEKDMVIQISKQQ